MKFTKDTKILAKKFFLSNFRLLFSAREKVLTIFKVRLFRKKLDKIRACEAATEPTVANEN